MVLCDQSNDLKALIFVRGLLKKKSFFQTTFEPNIMSAAEMKSKPPNERLIQGVIYKQRSDQAKTLRKAEELEDLTQVEDIEF